jgi:preprotein translocase subunit YajC
MYLATGSSSSSGLSSILLLVVIFGAFYFLLLRPMTRRQKQAANEAKQMRSNLEVNSDVVTIGGLYGTVRDMDDETVTVEISEGVLARFDRAAIAKVLPVSQDDTDDDDSATDDSLTDSTELDATANSIVEQKD